MQQSRRCQRGNANKVSRLHEHRHNQVQQISAGSEGKFEGSCATVQEGVVAMLVKSTSKKRRSPESSDDYDGNKLPPSRDRNLPPFLTHFQDFKGQKYKVSDFKEYKRKTYYLFDCPLHRNCLKWHMHTVDNFGTIILWLKK